MSENLMNSDHKATNKKSREGYDRIRWDRPKRREKDGKPSIKGHFPTVDSKN